MGPIKSIKDEDLKEIAKDLYNGLIFTDRHCSASDNASLIFMPLLFMGPKSPSKPSHPNKPDSTENSRDNAIYDVIQRDEDQLKYEEDLKLYKEELKCFNEQYLTSIGLVFEYLSAAGPTSVNGKPSFFSMRLLNIDDTKKMFEYYEKYKSIREEVDKF